MVYKFLHVETHNSLAHKIIEFFSNVSGVEAYGLVLGVLFFCGLGLPIPEDITLIAAGILAGHGQISLGGALIAGFFGVLIGDTILFLIGQKYGRRVFDWPVFNKFFTAARIAKAEQQIQMHARKICFTARFMPGLRAPIYLTAGIMGVPFRVFITQDGLAALLSVPVWIYLGYWFADKIDEAIIWAENINIFIIVLVLLGLGLFVYFQKFKKR